MNKTDKRDPISKSSIVGFRGFPEEGLKLLDDIALNNSKEWFELNRHRHDEYIVAPNRAFVSEMAEHLQILVPTINAIPKTNKSLFRIYRDARFHLDEPIKTKIGLIFWQGSAHRMQSSCFYMHYESSGVLWAGGLRSFKPPLLSAYRDYIQSPQRREEIHQILTTLRLKGYSIPEPHYKRYPAGFDAHTSHAYLSLHNSMFAYKTANIKRSFHNSKIVDESFAIFEDMLEIQQWVYELTLHQKEGDSSYEV